MSEDRTKVSGGIGLPKMLLTLDLFPEKIPVFNSQGKTAIPTYFGGLVSLVLSYVWLLYALTKIQHLMLQSNPQVVEFVERDAFDSSFEFHANEKSGHMLAVGLVDFLT